MKKKLIYLASICIGLTFAACSSDDGGSNPPLPTLDNSLLTHINESMSLYGLNDLGTPFDNIILSETGTAIIGPFSQGGNASRQRRTESTDTPKYLVLKYSVSGNIYTIYAENGITPYCQIEVLSKTKTKSNVKITLKTASELEDLVFEGEVSIGEKVAADEATTVLCREWTIASTRLRHTGEVTAAKHFENPEEAVSLNAILAYAKSVASIDEEFDDDMIITSIEFTSDGTFCIFFKNQEHYVGKWSWTDKPKGYIHYVWNDDENMGNEFENGEAVFDIRKFQQKNYYTLTLGADIESGGKTYKVELTFFLNEKTK